MRPLVSTTRWLCLTGLTVGLCLLSLAGLERYATGSRVQGHGSPLHDPQLEAILTDRPTEVYQAWKERGVRGRVITYVGASWRRIEIGDYQKIPLYRPYPLRLFQPAATQEGEFLNDGNFLYMAALSGVARKLTLLLGDRGFAEVSAMAETAKDVSHPDGNLRFPYYAYPRLFATAATFRAADEAVLLCVSASYFRDASAEGLLRTLVSAGLRTDFLALCLERDEATVSDRQRRELLAFAKLLGREAQGLPGLGAGAAP